VGVYEEFFIRGLSDNLLYFKDFDGFQTSFSDLLARL